MFAPPICRRRCGTALFRSVSSDEGGGNPANIAGSGASNQVSDVRAADLQEEMRNSAFPFRQLRRRRRQSSEHRRERSEQSSKRCSRRRSAGGDAEQRFSVPSAPTKAAAIQRTSQGAERAIK